MCTHIHYRRSKGTTWGTRQVARGSSCGGKRAAAPDFRGFLRFVAPSLAGFAVAAPGYPSGSCAEKTTWKTSGSMISCCAEGGRSARGSCMRPVFLRPKYSGARCFSIILMAPIRPPSSSPAVSLPSPTCTLQSDSVPLARKRPRVKVYIPNPPLDHALTATFLAEVAFVVVVLYVERPRPGDTASPFAMFGLYIALCCGMIWLAKAASVHVARLINAALLALDLVPRAPIVGRAQLNKWKDQSWQLVAHSSMAAFAVYVLTYECPGLWSDTSLAWTPSPYNPDSAPCWILKQFYLFQLVCDQRPRAACVPCGRLPHLEPSCAGHLDGDVLQPPVHHGTHQGLFHDVLPSHHHHRADWCAHPGASVLFAHSLPGSPVCVCVGLCAAVRLQLARITPITCASASSCSWCTM